MVGEREEKSLAINICSSAEGREMTGKKISTVVRQAQAQDPHQVSSWYTFTRGSMSHRRTQQLTPQSCSSVSPCWSDSSLTSIFTDEPSIHHHDTGLWWGAEQQKLQAGVRAGSQVYQWGKSNLPSQQENALRGGVQSPLCGTWSPGVEIGPLHDRVQQQALVH